MTATVTAGAYDRCVACVSTVGCNAMKSTGILPTATVAEAMAAPAVVIAPTGPWAHAQKDSVIEVARPVITTWCAGIRRIVVVAIRTYRRGAYVDRNLGAGRR